MIRLPRHPNFWIFSVLIWFAVLWWLSSSARPGPPMPPIAHLDKVAHFGYFFGGGGLLSAYFVAREPANPRWRVVFFRVVVILSLVGVLDEFHQSFIPGRTGNDPFDWLADTLGAFAGAVTFRAVHRQLKWDS